MLVRIEQSLFKAVPLRNRDHLPLHAEWGGSQVQARWPATSSAARASAPTIVAAARAEQPHRRLLCFTQCSQYGMINRVE
jgi:hypothetical protein